MAKKPVVMLDRGEEGDQEAQTKPLDYRLIVRLFRYTRPYARTRNWLLLMVVLRAMQLPLIALMTGWLMRGPIAEKNIWGAPFSEEGVGIAWGVGVFFGLVLMTNLVMHFRMKLAMFLGEWVIHDMRLEMFNHLQRMPMAFFDRTKIGRVISRFSSDAEAMRAGVQEVLFISIVNGGQMLVASGMMLWLDPVLFAIVAGLAPIVWMINRVFGMKFSKVHRAMHESFSRVTATIAESVGGIRVTQGFVRQDVNAEMFEDQIFSHSNQNIAVQRTNAMFNPLLELNNQFFIASLLLIGGYRVLSPGHDASAGDLIQFIFLANVFFTPIQALGTMYSQALNAMAGAERVFNFLDTKPDWQDPPDAIALPPLRGRVEFRDVCFEYVKDRPVLHDITFTVEPGQIIALVGHTGCGKSSIINLISKFYLPKSGELLIDGYNILQVDSDSLHRQMGIVLQVNFLFSGTVMENIKVGKPEATDEEVYEAARKLGCLDLLEALPDGLHTQVGERGATLSLGQRQLVCFTRAMLANPRIMILDEATSSVDTMTEARIQSSLEALFRDRTCFVVAHRLSTIRNATCVLVLNQGRIIERGSHNQLLATGGVYANLYRQFISASEAH